MAAPRLSAGRALRRFDGVGDRQQLRLLTQQRDDLGVEDDSFWKSEGMRFLGVDLAWGEGSADKQAADTGVAALEKSGRVVAAGWTCGIAQTLSWIDEHAGADALLFVDAPLVVENPAGQRLCEKQTGQRYGRWKASANTTNLGSRWLGGVTLRGELERVGWRYSDGRDGPPTNGRVVSECYPYTTLVGVAELGYDVERPRYKRPPKRMPTAAWKPLRAAACDELIARLASLGHADPPLDLRSQAETRRLVDEPSPLDRVAYKRREDLIDAVLSAWTAAFWHRHGLARCQVLGLTDGPAPAPQLATIIAPARPEQLRPAALRIEASAVRTPT